MDLTESRTNTQINEAYSSMLLAENIKDKITGITDWQKHFGTDKTKLLVKKLLMFITNDDEFTIDKQTAVFIKIMKQIAGQEDAIDALSSAWSIRTK